eukprot:scaffold77080_cov34-Phaeocystis_antarctica.AAC.2
MIRVRARARVKVRGRAAQAHVVLEEVEQHLELREEQHAVALPWLGSGLGPRSRSSEGSSLSSSTSLPGGGVDSGLGSAADCRGWLAGRAGVMGRVARACPRTARAALATSRRPRARGPPPVRG